ncbi:MAG: DUF3108 domain-containing protein [Pseudomonadota bacterium]
MYRLLVMLLLFISLPAHAQEREQLHFHLSYSGLLTGFMWKELADVNLTLQPEETTFLDQPASRIEMTVSTEHYGFAESFHALRYRWESILTPDLQRIQLVRVIDEGDSNSHDVYWYDWSKDLISEFRKRKQIDVSIPMFDDEDGPKLEWEKDTFKRTPKFIDPYPPVTEKLGYLIQKKYHKGVLNGDAIDPLTMLMRLRHHDFHGENTILLNIINEESLEPYLARLSGTAELQFNGCTEQAIKIEIRRSNHNGEDGVMHMWLSDDARRLPLRIDVDAPLGSLHIELQQVLPTTLSNSCNGNTGQERNQLLSDID